MQTDLESKTQFKRRILHVRWERHSHIWSVRGCARAAGPGMVFGLCALNRVNCIHVQFFCEPVIRSNKQGMVLKKVAGVMLRTFQKTNAICRRVQKVKFLCCGTIMIDGSMKRNRNLLKNTHILQSSTFELSLTRQLRYKATGCLAFCSHESLIIYEIGRDCHAH